MKHRALRDGRHRRRPGGPRAPATTSRSAARPFVILDANERVGDAWRKRWDSLRLFTPAKFSRLPGMRIPGASAWSFRDEGRDGRLPRGVRAPLRASRAHRRARRRADEGRRTVSSSRPAIALEADNVIVATGAHRIAEGARLRAPSSTRGSCRCTRREYRDPVAARGRRRARGRRGQLRRRDRLRARARRVAACSPGRARVRSPCRTEAFGSVRASASSGSSATASLRVDTRLGRKLGARVRRAGRPADPAPRRRISRRWASSASRASRASQDGLPVLEDGRVVDVPNVIWCTGLRNDFSWIDLPVFDERRPATALPRRRRVGARPLLRRACLSVLAVVRCAPGPRPGCRYIAKHIGSRKREARAVEPAKALAA